MRDQAGVLRDSKLPAEGRAGAAEDRAQAASDRMQGARDRSDARSDRDALLHQLTIAETDQLTGARTRAAGLADLGREIDRAHRTRGVSVAVAYADVVGLKVVNDLHGHARGDALLQRVVAAIRHQLRSYDLIVRLGGDEFLCMLSGATIESARQRFTQISASLALGPDPCEVRVGFAALEPEDDASRLIRRADASLLSSAGGPGVRA
ncbi:MAG: diguanylate cyclase [Thermoleophilaceae bacterium]|nr:diguanylate cyclase [Thermoleophilaceae bacterium]